jgi:hypothetical protein
MKKFLAVYTGTPAGVEKSQWNTLDTEKRKELEAQGMKAWGDWMKTHEAVIVDTGGPLGKTKRTDREGVSDTRNNLAGYVIVRAESHDAAAQMFKQHPHFTIFPGDSVEVMECLSVPGQ